MLADYRALAARLRAERLVMTVDGQRLRASVPLRGRHRHYDRYTMVGTFALPPGEHTLTLAPYILDPGILMNLRDVMLEPCCGSWR